VSKASSSLASSSSFLGLLFNIAASDVPERYALLYVHTRILAPRLHCGCGFPYEGGYRVPITDDDVKTSWIVVVEFTLKMME
jgi:hypothetical protein